MARRNKKITRASPTVDVEKTSCSTTISTSDNGSDSSTSSSSCTSVAGIDAVYNRSDSDTSSTVSEELLSQVVVDDQPDCQYTTTTNKQTVFSTGLWVCLLFSVGVLTGVVYVGWVQHQYGFGVDPVLEQRYLPYGPTTTERSCLRDEVPTGTATSTKPWSTRSIHLNRENPRHLKPLVPTLFGIEYSNVVATTRPSADSSDIDTARKSSPGSTQGTAKPSASSTRQRQVSKDWNRLASTPAVSITSTQANMMRNVAERAHENLPNLHHRAQQVSFGGPHNKDIPETNWWRRVVENSTSTSLSSSSESLDTIDGGHLLYAYLHIMRWDPNPKFPFRLCGEKGCPPERAIAHSLEWREKYRPWSVPPSLLEENANGYCYHRGFSPGRETQKHGTVWLRLGHHVQNDLAFFRGILNSVDRSIADGLVQSQGATGKFNVIIDCAGFSLANTPTVAALKQTVTMLQDHFPNRLGMIFLVDLPRLGQGFLNLVLRLITREVRDKIKVLPNRDPAKRMAILKTVLEEQWIPDWLGGTDTYQFHVDEYYPSHLRCTEEEAQEFLTTMPYHAK